MVNITSFNVVACIALASICITTYTQAATPRTGSNQIYINKNSDGSGNTPMGMMPAQCPTKLTTAVTVLTSGPPGMNVTGVITYMQSPMDNRVFISGEIKGLAPNSVHGYHVHVSGDLRNTSNPCLSLGAHYNPYNKSHGAPNNTIEYRHFGDLGNFKANDQGVATFNDIDSLLQLCGEFSIIGRGFVVHALMDDLGKGTGESSINGNSGTRIACGVIGLVG